ncbi:MAG: immunoglobulin-like domain-containing protein, partial [Chitinophagales bacterium]
VYDDGQLFGCPPVVEIDGFVNTDAVTSVPFEIQYTAIDQAENITEISRWVNVIGLDDVFPSILLTIDDPFNPTDIDGIVVTAEVEIGALWEDPGFVAFDNVDGLITDKVEVMGTVDLENIGDYTVTYTVTDNAGNITTITRIVEVRDTTEPNISIIGPIPATAQCGGNYIEFGANAFDDIDGALTSEIVIQVFYEDGVEYEEICTSQAGKYIVRYTVTDLSGNIAVAERLVIVQGECTSEDCKVGIEDTLFDTEITLFPNPTQGQFSINFHDLTNLQTQVEVFNLVGESVYESQQMIHQNPILKVDLSGVAAGMYLVKIQTPEGSLTKKVMIRD